MEQIITETQSETEELGKKIAKNLVGGDIVCLEGELGAGKTVLVKGIAAGLGIKAKITSPTFALMNVYTVTSLKSKVHSLIHIDTYRLKNKEELIEIGIEDYLGKPDTICVIEWPEKVSGLLRDKNIKSIKLKLLNENENEREIVIE